MNERRVEQVMQIEQQAQRVLDKAKEDAARLPLQAEREAQTILETTRAQARAEAEKLIEAAGAEAETRQILSEAEKRVRESDEAARPNLDRAVQFVVGKVLGRT